MKSKIIKIVYPSQNGTLNKWFTRNRWDVVTENCTYYVHDYATIRAIEILEDIYGGKEK